MGDNRQAEDGPTRAARELALEQAWRHFALHAGQRTTVFNFFVASGTVTLSGLVYVLATSATSRWFGLAAGVGAMLLALVFWKLDQRTAQLIKCSEDVMMALEANLFGDGGCATFRSADGMPVNMSVLPWSGTWSYGRSLRFLFIVVALLGLAGGCFSIVAQRASPFKLTPQATRVPTSQIQNGGSRVAPSLHKSVTTGPLLPSAGARADWNAFPERH